MIAGKMKKISVQELRNIQLEILRDVHNYCRVRGLRYSLNGGTLIGAVRHKGYIPWDDDIDIMMPRPDYEAFVKGYHSFDNEVLDLMASPVCVETFAKVSRRGTIVRNITLGQELWGVNIDIFPIDGFPDGAGLQEHFQKADSLLRLLGTVCPFYKTATRNKALWTAKYYLKRARHPFRRSLSEMKSDLKNLLISVPFESAPNAGIFCGGDGMREVMPKELFSEYTHLTFESEEFSAVKDYDAYLAAIFGDYMQLPPPEQRVAKHEYEYYITR